MILTPAGEFLMGSDPRKDEHAHEREQPQHTLYLPDFYIARTPVTNSQYAAFVEATGHHHPPGWGGGRPPSAKEEHPVVHVSLYDAAAYCRWLAQVTGEPYRLPSEAEWEKAARGVDGRVYPWGDQWEPGRCNTKGTKCPPSAAQRAGQVSVATGSGAGDTTPVGAYPEGASPYGVLDMAGNVYEWTISLWGKDMKEPTFRYPYDPSDGREDLEAGNGFLRVLRGGAFYYDAHYARAAGRVRSYPDYRVRTRGFRVAASASEPAP